MADLRELYQEVILDHSKSPRNFGAPEEPDGRADGHNPLCGDRLTVYCRRDGDRVTDVRFEGSGCAISMASASMMTESVEGAMPGEPPAPFAPVAEAPDALAAPALPVATAAPEPSVEQIAAVVPPALADAEIHPCLHGH